jgi:hypothetical protein
MVAPMCAKSEHNGGIEQRECLGSLGSERFGELFLQDDLEDGQSQLSGKLGEEIKFLVTVVIYWVKTVGDVC